MNEQDIVLQKVRRRVNRAVFLTRLIPVLAGLLLGFAVLYILLQMLAPQFTPWLAILAVTLPVAVWWAWYSARKRDQFFSKADTVELVDRLSGSDAKAITAYERHAIAATELDWSAVKARMNADGLRLDPAWFGWRLVPATLFAGAALWVPARVVQTTEADMIPMLTQPLADKVKMSAELLPEPEREKLEKQIAEIQAEPEGISREKWDAIEDLEQKVEQALAQSMVSTYQLSASVEQLASLVSEQNQAPNANNAELQAKIDSMAASLAEHLKQSSAPVSEEMKKQLANALSKCKNGNCKPGDLSKLREQLDGLGKKMQESKGEKEGVGRGGVDRGRADAPMIYGEERKLTDASFDAKPLENQYFENSDLADIGVTTLEPKPDPGRFKPGTLKHFGSQQGTNVSRTEISPSQKDVVSRYFE